MKSFFASRRTILNAAFALGLLAQASSAFALVDATWKTTPTSGDWNTNGNWSGASAPTGVATFGTSSVTSISLSAPVTITSLVFNAGASAFTITAASESLIFSTTGITNNSGIVQNFVANTDGFIEFDNAANAGSLTTFTNNGRTLGGTNGGFTRFYGTANAGSGAFVNNGATVAAYASGATYFYNSSNAGAGTFTNNGGTVSGAWGGVTEFNDTSHAGSATFNNNGTAVTGASGGTTTFKGSSHADTATLIANGGSGGGGGIYFYATSFGDTASVTANGSGFLDISNHTGAMGIGSIAGSGNFFLGSKTLTVGGNNLSTTVSGVIQDGGNNGGVGGGITKTGTGTMTLSGTNTYTGVTTVQAGTLQFANTGALYGADTSKWTNANLQVSAGATFALNVDSAGTHGFTNADLDAIGSTGLGGFAVNSTLAFDTSTATGGTFTRATGMGDSSNGLLNITKLGVGTLIFSGPGNYTGVTTVQAGTLQFATQASLYANTPASWTATNIVVKNGATLALNVDSAGTHGFTSASLDTIKALGTGTGGFLSGSTLALDTSTATGGTFTYGNVIANTNGGANILGFTKLGSGTLILTALNTYTGATSVEAGTLILSGGSASAMNVTSTLSVSSGGSLISGGAITISSGGLAQINGQLTSPQITVLGLGLLKGAGTIVGNVVNGGVVAPGNSPGTLRINGDFTQTRAGAFNMEIASLSNFDRLVVSGKANLGGTLQVQNYGGNVLAFGQQYSFIQAGSIVGNFDNITMPDAAKFRGRFLVDGGTGILLVAPESYALVAKTTNQMNVAKALDHYITAVGNDREVVSTALDKMSENQYPAAFDAISPAFHESIANITIEQAFVQTQMINQRLSSVRLGAQGFQLIGMNAEPLTYDKNGKKSADPKDLKTVIQQDNVLNWSTWAMGTGTFAKVTDVSQIPNSHSESGSCLIGADYRWNEHFSTGLYGGYQGTYVDYTNTSSNHMNSALFGGYATYTAGGFYADSVIGGGVSSYDVRRTIAFSTIKRTAQSDQQSGQLNAALNLGYDFKVSGFTLGPIAGAQYTYVGIAPFTESGASSLNLAVKQQNANSMRTTLGGRVAYTWNATSKLVLIPEVRMLWENEFLNGSRPIDASLAGGKGPSFSGWTDAPSRSSAFAGAGVSAQFGANWNASLFYNVDFGRQTYLANMISASLGLKF